MVGDDHAVRSGGGDEPPLQRDPVGRREGDVLELEARLVRRVQDRGAQLGPEPLGDALEEPADLVVEQGLGPGRRRIGHVVLL